jgi:uncharacterized protein YvpB
MNRVRGILAAALVALVACTPPERMEESTGAESALTAPDSIALDVPFVEQDPELPRGCEVTSLTMLLRGAGVAVDKMTLASQVDKVPYQVNGKYGNPNVGFVGDMYTFSKPGYGVYHAPVVRLADRYLPGRIVDVTNVPFDELLTRYVGQRFPVWIITNATFRALPASSFETWSTATGNVQITWEEHSVLITGYGPDFVLIHDPLASTPLTRHPRADFQHAWEQMGMQALTYLPAADGTGAVGVEPLPNPTPSACDVWSDGRLHCSNTPNTPMHQKPLSSSPVVNTLRSANSYFECWGTGEPHAGGNTTWYFTVGDDNPNQGYVPASVMGTTADFDANPSAHGLAKCASSDP